jgi:hypothetical protein
MKNTLLIIAVITLLSVTANAQKKTASVTVQNKVTMDSLIHEVKELRKELYQADSINKLILDGIYRNINKPRFKMYQTGNNYNLLKLDTKTGGVWQIQFRMREVSAQSVAIEYWDSVGVIKEEDGWDGRFELYPTNNPYIFIMIDTGTGATYQVQWSTESDYRYMERLF